MNGEQKSFWHKKNPQSEISQIGSLEQLVKELVAIREKGYEPTHRLNDTGVGKTLEDLLHLKENNLRLPDWGEIEIKGKRIKSLSMLTLATKSTEPSGSTRRLWSEYGYLDSTGFKNLHVTVYGSRYNNQGFKGTFIEDNLVIENSKHIPAFWPISLIFEDVLVSKSETVLLAFARTRGKKNTPSEGFHYVQAFLLSGLRLEKFKTAVENDKLKIDIRVGVYRTGKNKGKYHDHGTGLRINRRDFLALFDRYEQLL